MRSFLKKLVGRGRGGRSGRQGYCDRMEAEAAKRGKASATEVLEAMQDPPSNSVIRTLLGVLEVPGLACCDTRRVVAPSECPVPNHRHRRRCGLRAKSIAIHLSRANAQPVAPSLAALPNAAL